MRTKLFASGIILLFAFIIPVVALAGPIVNLQYQSVSPGQNLSLTFPEYGSGTVSTGVYNLLINGTPIDSFCVENVANTTSSLPYELLQITAGTKWEYAAYIASQHFNTGNADEAAAAQLAIWEIVLEGSSPGSNTLPGSLNVLAGSFRANASSTITTLAQSYLDSLASLNLSGFNENSWMIAVNPVNSDPNRPPESFQNYLVHVQAPVPAAVWLLGTGLVGLVGIRRKFKK